MAKSPKAQPGHLLVGWLFLVVCLLVPIVCIRKIVILGVIWRTKKDITENQQEKGDHHGNSP